MTYNTRSPAVKRLMKEAQELSEPTELFFAKPLEDNLFEWHFTIRGPIDTDYDGGIYHGRILLPAEYPMKPPNILLMTPSGRFEINRKICLSISGYHPETWRPSWSIRTAMLAIIGFMPTHGVGAIGSLDYPPKERRKLAKSSVDYVCPQCGGIKSVLKSLTEASVADVNEAKNLASQISFTGDKSVEKGGDQSEPPNEAVRAAEPLSTPPPAVVGDPSPAAPVPVPVPTGTGTAAPSTPQQPLSFEQWFYQMKSATSTQASNGSKAPDNAVPLPTAPVPDASTPARGPAGAVEAPEKGSPPPVGRSPDQQQQAGPDGEEAELSTHRRTGTAAGPPTAPAPAAAAATAPSTAANIDFVSIRNQQSMLLKCIVLVASVLGFVLVARLSSLHSEINN